jgi:RNA recognition motif-containing protein
MDVKLYVGNLPYTTSEDDLRALFAQAGTVASVALIKDRDTGKSKGFAFVEMATQAEAQKAITMFNAFKMEERTLVVNLARPREERSGGPGGGGFGNRRGGNSSGRGHDRRGGNRRF